MQTAIRAQICQHAALQILGMRSLRNHCAPTRQKQVQWRGKQVQWRGLISGMCARSRMQGAYSGCLSFGMSQCHQRSNLRVWGAVRAAKRERERERGRARARVCVRVRVCVCVCMYMRQHRNSPLTNARTRRTLTASLDRSLLPGVRVHAQQDNTQQGS